MNDYDVRVTKVRGEHVWHSHADTEEFFLVLDGSFTVTVRDGEHERDITLGVGDTLVVPRGVEHRPRSQDGASILMFEPSGTLTTGDYADEVPAHIDSTAGHVLADSDET